MENDNDPRVCKGLPPSKEVIWYVVPTDRLQIDKQGNPTLLIEKSTKMAVVRAQIAYVAWHKASIPSLLGVEAEQLTASRDGFVRVEGIVVTLVIEEGIEYGTKAFDESQRGKRLAKGKVFPDPKSRIRKSRRRNGNRSGRSESSKSIVRSRNKKAKR